jgi:hypothetical protein
LRKNEAALAIVERHFDRRANPDAIALAEGEIRHHQQHRLLRQFDNYIDEGRLMLKPGDIPLMHYGEGMDRSAPANWLKGEPL